MIQTIHPFINRHRRILIWINDICNINESDYLCDFWLVIDYKNKRDKWKKQLHES